MLELFSRTTRNSDWRESVNSTVSVVSRRLRTVRIIWICSLRSKLVVTLPSLSCSCSVVTKVGSSPPSPLSPELPKPQERDELVPAQMTRIPTSVATRRQPWVGVRSMERSLAARRRQVDRPGLRATVAQWPHLHQRTRHGPAGLLY